MGHTGQMKRVVVFDKYDFYDFSDLFDFAYICPLK